MAASARRDLFISIDGSIDGLSNAAKAGNSVLLDLKGSAVATVDQIEAKLKGMGSGAASGLAETERNFKATFERIRTNANAVLANDNGIGALKIIDAAGAQQAAEAANARAAALRTVAEAARAAAVAENGENAALNAFAASSAAASVEATRYAVAMNEQAGVLTRVAGQAVAAGAAQEEVGRRVTASTGLQKQGMQQLSYQLGDVATQYASGTSASIIFAQQSGQVIQALQLMITEGEGWIGTIGKFAPFVGAALVVLTPFVAKLFESADASEKEYQSLLKNREATDRARLAKDQFSHTLDGQIDKWRELNKEIEQNNKLASQAASDRAREAQSNLDDSRRQMASLRDQLTAARRELDAARTAQSDAQLLYGDSKSTAGRDQIAAANRRVAAAAAAVSALQAQIGKLDNQIAGNEQAVRDARIPVLGRDVADSMDAATTATNKFNDALADLNARFSNRLLGMSEDQYKAELRKITKARDDAIKAASDAEKTQPTGSPSSALLSSAESYRGASEAGAGRDSLLALFKSANINVDPKITAWCAAFVNAVLATNGLPGTGSLSAKSFLQYGTKTDAPQKGDIVVLNRAGGGHVGFFEGFDTNGNVKVLGGNQGAAGQGKVSVATFNRADVLGFRRAPSSGQSAQAAADAAATKEAERRAAFDRELADQSAKALELGRQLVGAGEEQLQAKLDIIGEEEAARVVALDNLVATGKLKSAEADQLKLVAARIADQKKSIAINKDIDDTRRKILAADRAEYEDKAALLDLQGQLATTNKERLRVARQLLDLELAQRRAAAEAKAASHDPEEAAAGARDLARVNAEEPLRRAALAKQYDSPLAKYRDQLKEATDDMSDALQGVAVHGLQTLEDGLLGVINGTETVASAFKKMAASIIADLARIAIEKAIVGAIGGIFGFSSGHVGGVGGSAVHLPSYAGGIIRGPGTGTSDSILAMMSGVGLVRVSNGESIMTAAATRRFAPVLKAMNDNSLPGFAGGIVPTSYPTIPRPENLYRQPQAVEVRGNFAIKPSPLFDVRMEEVAFRSIGHAAEPIMAGAESRTITRLHRPVLPGAGFG